MPIANADAFFIKLAKVAMPDHMFVEREFTVEKQGGRRGCFLMMTFRRGLPAT